MTPDVGRNRECPACGATTFELWWRVDLPSIGEPTTVVCAECRNSVGSAEIQDPRMPPTLADLESERELYPP